MKIEKVKTNYEGCEYITAGKVYDVVDQYHNRTGMSRHFFSTLLFHFIQ